MVRGGLRLPNGTLNCLVICRGVDTQRQPTRLKRTGTDELHYRGTIGISGGATVRSGKALLLLLPSK